MSKMKVNKELFGKRLKHLMTSFNENTYSMSRKFNLSAPSISRYSRGEMVPKITTIQAMAKYFDVNPHWLMGENVSMYEDEIIENEEHSRNGFTLSVFSKIAYDTPIFSNEKNNEILEFSSRQLSKWGSVFAMNINDDVMSPLLSQDDTVVIKLSTNPQEGNLVALHVGNDDLIIRKVILKKNLLILQPQNFSYDAEVFNLNQTNVQFIGRVVYKRHTSEQYFDQDTDSVPKTPLEPLISSINI